MAEGTWIPKDCVNWSFDPVIPTVQNVTWERINYFFSLDRIVYSLIILCYNRLTFLAWGSSLQIIEKNWASPQASVGRVTKPSCLQEKEEEEEITTELYSSVFIFPSLFEAPYNECIRQLGSGTKASCKDLSIWSRHLLQTAETVHHTAQENFLSFWFCENSLGENQCIPKTLIIWRLKMKRLFCLGRAFEKSVLIDVSVCTEC